MAELTLPDLRPLTPATFTRDVLGGDDGVSYFVLFTSDDPMDGTTEGALAEAQHEHGDKVRAFKAPYAEFAAEFARLVAGRKDIDTFNFQRAPVVGLYRHGQLVTTFNPRRVFYIDKQQAREVRSQLEIFLHKMVFFDPTKVREQVNLEVADKKPEHGPAAAKPAGGAG
ncbi:MAG TPA: hypothetical protein VNM16_13815 [Bacillota bacterium]|nr:hypothetical protein [Bacillota bacterium]